MEFFTIFLSSLLALVSPVGFVVDRIAENAVRSQFKKAEQLQVRIDNAPSYQLLQGRVQRVRIAGRGLQPKRQNIRIAVLELETDPISLDPRSLRKRPKLKRPFQAGVRLVLTQKDINQALQSLQLIARLRKLRLNEIPNRSGVPLQRYNFVDPRVEFLANNRLRFQVKLQQQGNIKPLAIRVESGLLVLAGRQIQLVQPSLSVDGQAAPAQLVSLIAANLSKQLDLKSVERYGLQVRILQLRVAPQELEIAAFLRVEPSSRLLRRRASM